MRIRHRPERTNRAAGTVCLIGAALVGLGGLLPWAVVSGPQFSIDAKFFSWTPNTGSTAGGIADGGLFSLAVGAGVAGVALFLFGAHRWRGLTWRILLLLAGLQIAAAGVILIYAAATALDAPDHSNLLQQAVKGLERTVTSVDPGPGAYAILVGGALITFGALIPGRLAGPAVIVLTDPTSVSRYPTGHDGNWSPPEQRRERRLEGTDT